MPKLSVPGEGTFEVENGTRLVLALEMNGIDVSHRCGGNAKCTTCRCSFENGEPSKMTQAEKEKIDAAVAKGDEQMKTSRLSCQIEVDQDMTVTPLMRVRDADWDDPGNAPSQNITPDPVWL